MVSVLTELNDQHILILWRKKPSWHQFRKELEFYAHANEDNEVLGARGGTVGRDTAIQSRRPRVRFPMCSFRYFIDLILIVWSTQLLTEMITKEYFLESKCGHCVVLTTLRPSCAEHLQTQPAPNSCPDPYKNSFISSCNVHWSSSKYPLSFRMPRLDGK